MKIVGGKEQIIFVWWSFKGKAFKLPNKIRTGNSLIRISLPPHSGIYSALYFPVAVSLRSSEPPPPRKSFSASSSALCLAATHFLSILLSVARHLYLPFRLALLSSNFLSSSWSALSLNESISSLRFTLFSPSLSVGSSAQAIALSFPFRFRYNIPFSPACSSFLAVSTSALYFDLSFSNLALAVSR